MKAFVTRMGSGWAQLPAAILGQRASAVMADVNQEWWAAAGQETHSSEIPWLASYLTNFWDVPLAKELWWPRFRWPHTKPPHSRPLVCCGKGSVPMFWIVFDLRFCLRFVVKMNMPDRRIILALAALSCEYNRPFSLYSNSIEKLHMCHGLGVYCRR